MKYLVPFIISVIISMLFASVAIFVGKKIKWTGRKSKRHMHKRGVSRLGGVAMVLAFNLTILINRDLVMTPEILGFIVGSLTLMAVGFWDDIKEMYWKTQLFFQIFVSILVFILGLRIYYVTNPITGGILNLESGFWVVLSIFIIIVWIVLVINSMNWLDGMDGLSGGVALIAALTVFFLSLKAEVYQPPVAIIAVILSGVILGFLVFNFYPAKILAGTSGAMFLGFSLAVLAVISGTKIATALLVLALPIIDSIRVIGERFGKGSSIFKPDRHHLHYKLHELGWHPRKIAFFYYFITLVIAVVALNTRAIGKGITMALAAVIIVAFSMAINKKISVLDEKNS